MTNLHLEDASDEFFAALKDICDSEEKRKVIGETFLQIQRRVLDTQSPKLQPPPSLPAGQAGLWPASKAQSWLLGQGTIYPDTIETGGTRYAAHIKTHHNRVPEIQTMIDRGEVIEPLKDLYKDEVRALGEELGLPHDLVWRHPFPGPGLAVRILCVDGKSETPVVRQRLQGTVNPKFNIQHSYAILPVRSVGVQGDSRTYRHAVVLFSDSKVPTEEHWRLATEIPNICSDVNRVLLCLSHATSINFLVTPGYVTRERADLLRAADAIVDEEMREAGLYESIWQFPVVLLPIGVHKGGQSIVLRPIESSEAMTANAVHIPEVVVRRMTKRLLTLRGIDAVFYDLTSKPPATIEWE